MVVAHHSLQWNPTLTGLRWLKHHDVFQSVPQANQANVDGDDMFQSMPQAIQANVDDDDMSQSVGQANVDGDDVI